MHTGGPTTSWTVPPRSFPSCRLLSLAPVKVLTHLNITNVKWPRKRCLLMNNTMSMIFFFLGAFGKSCSQVVNKYFNACLLFGRLCIGNNVYNHCKWARDSDGLCQLWGSEAASSEANPALTCLEHFLSRPTSPHLLRDNSPLIQLKSSLGAQQ